MNQTKNTAVLLLGANLGDKYATFERVQMLINERVGEIVKLSAIHTSQAWGFTSDDEFINQVLVVETALLALETLLACQKIEIECGRVRHSGVGYESRTIDIDILYWNHEIINLKDLQVPHPLLHLREFTLVPLCEVLPNYVHPILGKTNEELRLDGEF